MLYFILGVIAICVMVYVIVNFKFRSKKRKKLNRNIHYSYFARQHIFNNQDDYQTLNQQQMMNNFGVPGMF